MPSFDIVSKPDMPSINNAIDGVTREISTRYDFKGSKSKVEIIEEMIIVIADDDGAVVVPVRMARDLALSTTAHEEWEEFSRLKLAEGGSISKYYPLSEEGQREYELWRAEQDRT